MFEPFWEEDYVNVNIQASCFDDLDHINIGVRAGGALGAAAPKFWATQIFWATREILGKASF